MASSSPSAEASHTSPQQLGKPEDNQLAAPSGWQKKIASTKSGGTPRRGAVYFIAPDGKEIRSKRSLEGYLKGNPGGPLVAEFDWSTGETPRRSSRLGAVTPGTSPESSAGNRRVRRKVAVEDEAPETDERMGATSVITEEVMKVAEKVDERDAVEVVKPMEKVEFDMNNEVEKVVEKPEEHKIGECASEVKLEEYKSVECASEAKVDELQTVETFSEVGMEGKKANAVVLEENGSVEERVKQEDFGGGKVQTEEGELEKLSSAVMEEIPVEVVRKTAKHDGVGTNNGNTANCEEEEKQEGSGKPIFGLAQLSETPEASRPNGTTV